jgi:hypothetical protein
LAFGHGEGDSDQSLVLIRRAIAYLANKPGDQMHLRWLAAEMPE